MRLFSLLLCVLGVMAVALPSAAQTADDPGLQKRIELARAMHDIKPLSVQIEESIKQLSMRYPEEKRALFVAKMMETFDQKTLTDISVKAMAETFTETELTKMVDFYGSPEGKSISAKNPVYQSLVQPEIIKKIDQALMEVRTGKAGDQ